MNRTFTRGMSLVEFIIAFAVITICIAVLYKVAVRSYHQSAHTRDDLRASRLRSLIASQVQCPALRPAGCSAPGTTIQLLRKNGSVLIKASSPPSNIMEFEVRAQCVDCVRCSNGKKILIEYLRRTPGDTKGRIWEDLHDGMPFHCVIPP